MKGTPVKTIIKVLLIAALVSLLAIVVGCKEEGDNVPANDSLRTAQEQATTAQDSKALDNPDATKAAAAQAEDTAVTLYFSDDQAEFLVPETRQIANVPDTAKAAIEELIKGPQEDGNNATIPSGTQVLGVEVNQGIAYVNFSKELIDNHWGGSTGELMTISSIVNTLTEFENIQKVQILVEGKVVETIAGHADVSKPFARNEAIVKK